MQVYHTLQAVAHLADQYVHAFHIAGVELLFRLELCGRMRHSLVKAGLEVSNGGGERGSGLLAHLHVVICGRKTDKRGDRTEYQKLGLSASLPKYRQLDSECLLVLVT